MVYLLHYNRVVEGFNKPFQLYAYCFGAAQESCTVNAPTGPGRVEGLILHVYLPAAQHIGIAGGDWAVITIDGEVYFDDYAFILFWPSLGIERVSGVNFNYNYVVNKSDNLETGVSLDYEVSFSAKFQHLTADNGKTHVVHILGRSIK